MSLILDALRKSEAERRRGQTPDLFASLPAPTSPPRPGMLRLWPLAAVVTLLAVAGLVFWPGQEAASPPIVVDTAQTGAPESTLRAPLPSARRAPPPSTAPPPQALSTAVTAPAPRAPVADPVSIGPAPAGQTRVPDAPIASLPSMGETSAATAATAEAADDEAESLPPIAVLSAGERAGLPPLKLSMHVWGSEPGRRFAIIDGRRVTEGSTAGTGVIEEIRRDGVVLNINGRRILLPRP